MNAIFTYNFVNKTIVGTKSAINRANMGKNPEYATLCEMLAAHPDFAVVEKQIKRNPDKKKYNGLTLDTMRAYIATQPDSEKHKAEFEGLLLIAKTRGAMYPLAKKWFLENYPEFKGEKEDEKIVVTEEAIQIARENAKKAIAAPEIEKEAA